MTLASLPAISASNVPVVSAAQMAEVDRIVAEERGSTETLMDRAAYQVAIATRHFLGEVEGVRVGAIAGRGNNGGDALAAAHYLRGFGATVEVFVAYGREQLRPLPRRYYDVLTRMRVPVQLTTAIEQRDLAHRLRAMDVVLDGLLGYSAHDAPRGEIARLIQTVFAAGKPGQIIAVDIPSGLHPDTGENMSKTPLGAIPAALTVTLGLPKPGLFNATTRHKYVGDLVLADIGIPPTVYQRVGIDASGVFAQGDLLRIVS